ncbi:MAG: zinc ribbon domain-containing protein [Desulfobacterales bacterium]
MFLIAGISHRAKAIEEAPRLCPDCGLAQAYLKRVDQYVTLFFIPILRVKKGEPFLTCVKCQRDLEDNGKSPYHATHPQQPCKYCGNALESTFSFCPNCGRQTGNR